MKKKHLFRNFLIIAIIIWGVMLAKQQINISKYNKEIKNLLLNIEVAREKLNQNKQDLEEENKNTKSLEYIEKLAREKLGMYLQNERVYVDSNM